MAVVNYEEFDFGTKKGNVKDANLAKKGPIRVRGYKLGVETGGPTFLHHQRIGQRGSRADGHSRVPSKPERECVVFCD